MKIFTKFPGDFVKKLTKNFLEFFKILLDIDSKSGIIIIEKEREEKEMKICDLNKSDILTYLYRKNQITAEEMHKHFLNTPKYDVETLLINYLKKVGKM